MTSTKQFNAGNFDQEVLKSDRPVLVDLWAPWCGPCNAVGPVIDELASEHGADFKIGKLNVDDDPSIAQTYGVNSIPTVLVFKDGEVVDRLVGIQPKDRYAQALHDVA